MGTASSSPADGSNTTISSNAGDGLHNQEDEGGPWELDLGIPFGAISEVRPLADGTACT